MGIQFRTLEAEDIGKLAPYFSLRSNLSCDSVIFDSYLWRDCYEVEFAVAEDTAVLMKMRYEGENFGALPICAADDMPRYFRMLERYFREELGEKLKIYGADEAGVAHLDLNPAHYEVREEPSMADYIYDAESLRTLTGKKYHKKKNHVNAFLRNYQDRWEYRRLGSEAKEEIWSFLSRWEQGKQDDVEEHLAAEAKGLHDYLNHMECFDAVMAGIYVDGQLEAFTIGSYNPVDRMSVVHVEKANGSIRGLYSLINQQFQAREFPEARLVNREDDMGIVSLRKAKESYHPIMMGRKYSIFRL